MQKIFYKDWLNPLLLIVNIDSIVNIATKCFESTVRIVSNAVNSVNKNALNTQVKTIVIVF